MLLSSVDFRVVDREGKEEARLLRLESAVRRDPDSVIIAIASRSTVARHSIVCSDSTRLGRTVSRTNYAISIISFLLTASRYSTVLEYCKQYRDSFLYRLQNDQD
jgi:hypothetical protein